MKKRVILISISLCCWLFFAHKQEAGREPQKESNDTTLPISRMAVAFGSSEKVRFFSALNTASKSTDSKSTDKDGQPKLHETGRSIDQGPYPANTTHDADKAIARPSLVPMPGASLSVDGLTNFDNIAAYNAVIIPPDMIGDVGPNHYVQAVNALVRIFDKSGNALTPPFKMSQLFTPLGTLCSTRDDGEPAVLYDSLADRWLISQYCNNFPPFRQMIAISKTGDPAGAYHLYEFVMPNIKLNDVAKFGSWPDGYYMSTEEFTGADFSGSGMFAFDRAKMLSGDLTASYIYFNRPSATTTRLGNLLPSDLDGLRPPPAGAPNVFVGYTATEYGDAQDAIKLFDFHVDFINPLNSTFTERAESPLGVASFDPTSLEGRADITQPAPGDKLDANSDRLNYRVAYRNFGTSESLVVNQTVRLSIDPYRAGVRLYELKRNGGVFAVTEHTTIGNNTSSRWIGSAAQDHQGNMVVGYNLVADDRQPSINYSGRLAAEPTGTFREEGTLIAGTGVQKAFGWRWGDYSGMSVDPTDDCTFWMTGEYYTLESQNFSDFTWLTRIGAFKFAECTQAPRAGITGNVTNALSGTPIEDATVAASVYSRTTAANGDYGSLAVIPGSYMVTASANGFRSQSFIVNPANGQTLTQNFSLQPVPVLQNVGTIVSAESCGTNGAPDPGETVTISVALRNAGSLPTQNLTAELLPGGGVVSLSRPRNYGALAVNGPSVTRPFSFTVLSNVICGSPLTLTFHLKDGAEDLGNLTIILQTGTPKIAFRENFDRSLLGFLPQRWLRWETHSNPFELPFDRNWRVNSSRSTSPVKAAYAKDLQYVGINEMVTPVFRVTTPLARLTFQNWYEFETTFLRNRRYDGSVLEIKIGNADWQDIIAAGGVFESGGYDGPLDACCQNPLATRPGWSGRSGINQVSEFITTSVRLPVRAAGQPIQLRWRVGTDIGGFREGQYIDDLIVTDGFVCGCSG